MFWHQKRIKSQSDYMIVQLKAPNYVLEKLAFPESGSHNMNDSHSFSDIVLDPE